MSRCSDFASSGPFGVPAIAFSRRVARACRRRGTGFEGERMPHRLLRFLVEQGSLTPIPLSRASSATATGAAPRATHQCQCRHCSIIAERPAKHFSDRAVWCRAGRSPLPLAKGGGLVPHGAVAPLSLTKRGGLVPRFKPTSPIWYPRAEETPGHKNDNALSRVPNRPSCQRLGTKSAILSRKDTKARYSASKCAPSGTKPRVLPKGAPSGTKPRVLLVNA